MSNLDDPIGLEPEVVVATVTGLREEIARLTATLTAAEKERDDWERKCKLSVSRTEATRQDTRDVEQRLATAEGLLTRVQTALNMATFVHVDSVAMGGLCGDLDTFLGSGEGESGEPELRRQCPICGREQFGSCMVPSDKGTAVYWHADGTPDACTPPMEDES